METVRMQFTGIVPLLMHRPTTVNPLEDATREIKALTSLHTSKKTPDVHAQIMRLDWDAGLYHAPDIGAYLPGVNVETCLRDSGKVNRLGTAVTRGVIVVEDRIPLIVPQQNGRVLSRQELWDQNLKDYRRVGNQQNSVMRCRPCFPQWRIEFSILLNEEILDRADLVRIAERAGMAIGLGDYRPRFGRFEVA